MQHIALIQPSLRKGWNTEILCLEFIRRCKKKWIQVNYIDLKDIEMEFCDARPLNEYSQDLQDAYKTIEKSELVIFGLAVYGFTMSGVLKNFIDICGGAAKKKQVGVIINSWWPDCYLAGKDLLISMFYEHECPSLFFTPYTYSKDYENGKLVNKKVLSWLDDLINRIISL